MTDFTPIASLVGGIIIGVSASILLLLNGRIAGISGIVGGLLAPKAGETLWRLLFVAGLTAGGVAIAAVRPGAFAGTSTRPLACVIVAGLLVGYGTRLGGGCTSGHGVCGTSRLSKRSIAATATFMATGMLTVAVLGRLLGGSS
jgi:uncharacterized membrane protein YedE/YeeE